MELAFGLSRTVSELRRTLTHREYVDWIALSGIHPFGESAADLRAGMQMSLLANINRNRKKKAQPFSWLDFIYWRKPADHMKRNPEGK